MKLQELFKMGYQNVKVPKDRNTRGVLYLRNVPSPLKQLFKSLVTRRGETMEEVVREMMHKYVTDPGCVARWKKKRTRQRKGKS